MNLSQSYNRVQIAKMANLDLINSSQLQRQLYQYHKNNQDNSQDEDQLKDDTVDIDQEEDEEDQSTNVYQFEKQVINNQSTANLNRLQSNMFSTQNKSVNTRLLNDETEKEAYKYDDDNTYMNTSKIQNVNLQLGDFESSFIQQIEKIFQENNFGVLKFIEGDNEVQETLISKVYKCERADKRTSALKYMKSDDITDLEKETQVWDELQKIHSYYGLVATATLHNHLNLIGEQNGVLILMEYLDSTLFQIIKNNQQYIQSLEKNQKDQSKGLAFTPLTPNIITKIMRDLLSSLFLMHMNGIYHLDIKPHNSMYHQNIDKFVFIDFGSADFSQHNNDVQKYKSNFYRSNTTPQFCPYEHLYPPEHYRDLEQNEVNPYALDIWACGILFFDLTLIYLQIEALNTEGVQSKDFKHFQELYAKFYKLRQDCKVESSQYRFGSKEKKKGEEYYAFISETTKKIHFNLNRDDIEIDYQNGGVAKRGINHLQLMLMKSSDERINVFELAIDLNLPVLQQLIHSPPVRNFRKHMTQQDYHEKIEMKQRQPSGRGSLIFSGFTSSQDDLIVYINGTVYEGPVSKTNQDVFKRHGKNGKLYIANPYFFEGHKQGLDQRGPEKIIIYEGEWQDDLPLIQDRGIYIRLPIRIRSSEFSGYRFIKVKLRNSNEGVYAEELCLEQYAGSQQIGTHTISHETIRQKYSKYDVKIHPKNRFNFKKCIDENRFILKSQRVMNLYNEQELFIDNAINNVSFHCSLNEVLYGPKILQAINFSINLQSDDKIQYTINVKLQSNVIENQSNFYKFLCRLTHQYPLSEKVKLVNIQNDDDVYQICQLLFFITKYMNFCSNNESHKINYDIHNLQFPIQNLNDSQLINLSNCFKRGSQIYTMDFSQSVQISNKSKKYLFAYFDFSRLKQLNISGTQINDLFAEQFTKVFQATGQLEDIDFSYCEYLSDNCISQILLNDLKQLKKFKANYSNFGQKSLKQIWTSKSYQQLEILELQGCSQFNDQILDIIKTPTNLKALQYLNLQQSITNPSIVREILLLRQTDLLNLDQLNIACNKELTQAEIIVKDLKIKPLKFLDISWTQLNNVALICKYLVDSSTRFLYRGVKSIVDDNQIENILTIQSVNDLDICCLDVEEESIEQSGIEKRWQDIQTVCIQSCFHLTKQFFDWISNLNFSKITDLNLTGSLCDDETLKILSQNSKACKIQRLNLSKCIQITDLSIQHLNSSYFAQEIKELDLSFTSITDLSLSVWKEFKPWKQLEVLVFRMCKKLSDEGVINLFKANWIVENLKFIDLSHNYLGYKSLRKCIKVSTSGLSKSSQLINLHCCPSLYKPQPLPTILKDYEGQRYQFRKLTKENLLSICECPQTQILLPKLDLNNIHQLSDPIFTQILQSKSFKDKTEPNSFDQDIQLIELINLSFTNIGPMSIRLLADQQSIQQNIRELNLAGCRLGDLSISRLIRHGFPRLRILNISQTQVTDNVFKKIHEKLEVLQELKDLLVNWCDDITKAGIIMFRVLMKDEINLKCQPYS